MTTFIEIHDGDETTYINPAHIVEIWPRRENGALELHLLFTAPGWVFKEGDPQGPYTICLDGAEAERVLTLLLGTPVHMPPTPQRKTVVRCPHCQILFRNLRNHLAQSRECKAKEEAPVTTLHLTRKSA